MTQSCDSIEPSGWRLNAISGEYFGDTMPTSGDPAISVHVLRNEIEIFSRACAGDIQLVSGLKRQCAQLVPVVCRHRPRIEDDAD